jgi:hypothetical protein
MGGQEMKRLKAVVLAVAACWALAGCGQGGAKDSPKGVDKVPPSPDGSPVLARVGDYLITARQVEARIKGVSGKSTVETNLKNTDVVQIALAALVDQVTWAMAAQEAGYAEDPILRRDVYLYETEKLATKYLQDRIEKDALPPEEEILEFYEKNKEHYVKPVRSAVRHIFTADRTKAEGILKRILHGEDFTKLAREESEDLVTRDFGGALGYVSIEEGALGYGKDIGFLSGALKLKKGEISPVVQSSKGFHIILCEEREGGDSRPLEEVREDVIDRIKRTGRLSQVYNEALTSERKKHKAEIFQSQVDEYCGTSDSAERLWGIVELQPNERGQIEVLRRISFDFNKHDLADDAQLRIAYIYAVQLKEPKWAEKALRNMKSRFPRSDLLPAAEWLLTHLKDPEIALESFDDLKAKAHKG